MRGMAGATPAGLPLGASRALHRDHRAGQLPLQLCHPPHTSQAQPPVVAPPSTPAGMSSRRPAAPGARLVSLLVLALAALAVQVSACPPAAPRRLPWSCCACTLAAHWALAGRVLPAAPSISPFLAAPLSSPRLVEARGGPGQHRHSAAGRHTGRGRRAGCPNHRSSSGSRSTGKRRWGCCRNHSSRGGGDICHSSRRRHRRGRPGAGSRRSRDSQP